MTSIPLGLYIYTKVPVVVGRLLSVPLMWMPETGAILALVCGNDFKGPRREPQWSHVGGTHIAQPKKKKGSSFGRKTSADSVSEGLRELARSSHSFTVPLPFVQYCP